MKKLLLIFLLIFASKLAFCQKWLPLLGFSNVQIKERLKDNGDFKFISEGHFSDEAQHGGDTYLYYKCTDSPEIYIMYLFSNNHYSEYDYKEKLDDNQCYGYQIVVSNKNLLLFVNRFNDEYIKKTGYAWESKDKTLLISFYKGGKIKVNGTTILLPSDSYSTLNFSSHDPDEIEFKDRLPNNGN